MIVLTVLAVLGLDLFSKYWINHSLPLISYVYPYGGIGVFKDFFGIEFSLVHATNTGAAWGIFSDHATALFTFRVVLIAGLILYYLKEKSPYLKLAIALIIAGALGNIIDIFLYGHVIDMFHFVFWGYHYPVFNIADSAICIGVCLYLLFSWYPAHDSQTAVK